MLQGEIDAIDYPPTHQYQLEPLEPKNMLEERVARIPVEFFHGESFLDIGCNKGFFSLWAKRNIKYVEGIDYDQKCVRLCKKLGIKCQLTTFRDYVPDKRYDRIMMGNIMHYMYRECGDWTFIIKLAAISTGLVLIEAPTGMDCVAMKPVFQTKKLRKNFNEESFMGMMTKFFTLKMKVKSPSNNRWIMLFERLPLRIDHFVHKLTTIKLKSGIESTVYKHRNTIIKIQTNTTDKDFIKTFVAAHSPISNGIDSWLFSNGMYVGWSERISKYCSMKKFKHQIECFQKLCEHNVYLAKLGYTEMDMSVTNFFSDFKFYDKGGVWNIKDLEVAAIEDIITGYFFKMFRNSFKIKINFDLIHTILNKRDSVLIEILYQSFIIDEPIKKSKLQRLFHR